MNFQVTVVWEEIFMGIRNQRHLYIYGKKSRFAFRSRCIGCPYKSLRFCIKYLSIFWFTSLEFSYAYLQLIPICQQLPLAVINNGKGFWRAIQSWYILSYCCNVQIVFQSQPYMALVWKLVFWLFLVYELQYCFAKVLEFSKRACGLKKRTRWPFEI